MAFPVKRVSNNRIEVIMPWLPAEKFADATCDEQWIHVDQERAKAEMPGGKTIAHGLLSLSLTPMFIRSVMGLRGVKNTLN